MLGIARNNDVELVRRTLSGQRDAFGLLVDRYLRFAYAIAYARAHSRGDADDVVQDSFLAAFQQLNTLREPARFSAWLATIIRRLSGKSIQRARLAESAESAAAPSELVHPEHEREELRALIRTEVQALDESDREVILLCYFAGKSAGEIAAALDSTPAAIRKRLQRAREKLGERLLATLADPLSTEDHKGKQIMGVIGTTTVAWASATSLTAAASVTTGGGGMAMKLAVLISGVIAAISGLSIYHTQSNTSSTPSLNSSSQQSLKSETQETFAANASSNATTAAAQSSKLKTEIADSIDLSVEGVVLSPDGQPMPAVPVRVQLFPPYNPIWRALPENPLVPSKSVMTDENGIFLARFQKVKRDKANTYILAEIFAQTDTACRYALIGCGQPQSSLYQLELIPYGSVRGVVRDAKGSPVPDAIVAAHRFEPASGLAHTFQYTQAGCTTDKDGRYTLNHLYMGRWKLWARAEGFASITTDFIETNVELDITLAPGKQFDGRLVDSDTEASAAKVTLRMTPKELGLQEIHDVITDDEGRFRFKSLRECEYVLSTNDATRFISQEQSKVSISDDRHDTTIALIGGGSITGRILDAETREGIGGVVPIAQSAGISDEANPRTSARALTDANGVYTFEGLPEGQYQLMFRSGVSLPPLTPEARKNLPKITVAPGATVAAPDYVVSRKFRIDGIVKDESGQPVPSVYIDAYGLDHPEWYDASGFHFDALYTDEQGRFTKYLPGPSNDVIVVARKSGLVAHLSHRFKVDGEKPDVIPIKVVRVGRILGRVEDSGGGLLSSVEFNILGASATALNVVMENATQKKLVRQFSLGTGWAQDGRFYLTNVPADDYRLTFKNSEQLVTVAPGDTVTGVVLAEKALGNVTLVGHVRCEGEPIPNVTITLHGKEPMRGERVITSKDDGSFMSSGMSEGEYLATAQYGYTVNGVQTFRHLDPNFQLPSSGTQTFDIDFAQGDSGIEGYVKVNGRGAAAELFVSTEWGHRYVEGVTVYANEDGYYRITGLPAGKPNLKMARRNGTDVHYWPIEVETIAGQVTRHDITFGTGTITAACSGMHEGADGRILVVPGDHDVENLTLLEAYGLLEEAVFDKEVTQDQNFSLKDFPEGTYTVLWATYDTKAETDEARFASTKFTAAIATVEPGQETRLQLALP